MNAACIRLYIIHTYPIVVAEMKGDTWPLIASRWNKKRMCWMGCCVWRFFFSPLHSLSLSTRQSATNHRRCVYRNALTAAPFLPSCVTAWIHAYMSWCTWPAGQMFSSSGRLAMEQQQNKRQRGAGSSAEAAAADDDDGEDPTDAPLLLCKL